MYDNTQYQQATPLDIQPESRGRFYLGDTPKTPVKEKMMKWISFLCGLPIGGAVGVIMMCLMQINRKEKWMEDFYEASRYQQEK